MTRNRLWTPAVMLLAGTALLALLLALQARGHVSGSGLDLWGRTLLANARLIAIDDILTAFPPLSYLGSIVLASLFPWLGPTTPSLLAAMLGGVLVGGWFATLRDNGFGRWAAPAATLLLGANPLFLRAVAEGPAFVLLHWGVWLLALGMFQLRRGHRVNDIILIALALVLIGLSHPLGLVLTFAVLPFLALVMPPDRLRDAPAAAFLVLLFPLLFTAASFLYVNWIFGGAPLHFLDTLSRETAGLGTGAETNLADDGLRGLHPALLAAIGIIAACPIGVSMFVRTSGMPPLRFAVLALLGWLVSATILAALFDLLPSPALVAGLGVPLAAACAVRWPHERPARRETLLLLLAGMIGALVLSMADDSSETHRWRRAALGQPVPPPDPDLAELAVVLKQHDGILFDAEAAPAVVALRGRAAGIFSAETQAFQLAGLGSGGDAKVLVVRNHASSFGSDRIGRMFPELYDLGRPGYVRVFDSERWRVYARREKAPL
ncbi:hypothetical protein B2G71_21955 [Novosphingobium sp. PC22D]|uniref:hypothetical protein n=1 Tax=Novosphingobium sp. PC22D TaxID=1962403 RepID=UPI000BF1F387|nr:hypothetical protein [Novosphingobium sp. PC22D]PEQ10494.1 hypothetical protein B2G71_21955 [Novosphingobium sp. PC22D]